MIHVIHNKIKKIKLTKRVITILFVFISILLVINSIKIVLKLKEIYDFDGDNLTYYTNELISYQKRLVNSTTLLNKVISTKSDLQTHLFETVSNNSNSHGVNFINFSPPFQIPCEGYENIINKITFSGNFKNLGMLIDELEKKTEIGIIVSVNFFKKPSTQNEINELFSTIYIQNLKKL